MDDEKSLLIPLVTIIGILLAVILTFLGCCYYRRKRRRRGYQMVEESELRTSPWASRTVEQTQVQERAALLTCHFYIRTTGEYTFQSQLNQLGYDPAKSWFMITPLVKNSTISISPASHVLTINPKSDRLTQLTDEASSVTYSRTLNNLFSRLFHPYVEPIVRIDLLHTQQSVVTVKRYQRLGSLKDILHGSAPTATFNGKYSYRSSGLALERVRNYSRQLLEGLLFLQSRSMPPMVDLHSGNVVVVGSAVQIGSYEYPFLEQRSRIHQIVKRATGKLILPEGMTRAHASEVFCFGGIVFEMLSGYELGDNFRGLTPKHWHDCGRDAGARQMLTRLFDITQPVLTLTEIKQLPYFTNQKGPLKEMENFTPIPGEYTNDVKALLEKWASTRGRRSTTSASGRTPKADRRQSTTAKKMETSIINLSYSPNITPSTPSSAGPVEVHRPTPPPPPPPPAPSQGVPRPPPPPAAPPPPAPAADSGDRSALLEDIRGGMKLKKTVTNDRSAPKFK